jgi:LPPG:FO 2-phospho-L-lactate transferase
VITVLCGGVGAAKMLRGLAMVVPADLLCGIVNVGDDLVMHGLRICPDLDTITYTLAGLDNTETGWGLAGESWRVMEELSALGGESWFSLGDRDLATHLYRTQRLAAGGSLTEITAELLAHHGVGLRLLPVTEDSLATVFTTPHGASLSFQEYFVKHHHSIEVSSVSFEGAEAARPGAGVLEAIESADRIVISPSNPMISIAPILAVPGVLEALRSRRDDVVAVSPLIGGKALKGPADRLMGELGHPVSNGGIASLYREFAATLIIDFSDAEDAADVIDHDMDCFVTNTVMDSPERSETLAMAVLSA